MPRVENSGENVDEWWEKEQCNGSSTHDVCRFCVVELRQDPKAHNDTLLPYNGDPQGDHGWFEGVDHPPYIECDYTCEVCGERLTWEDD